MPNPADAERLLMDFFRDMWEWERSCTRRAQAESGPNASYRQIDALCLQYRNEVLRKYCPESVTEPNLSMGTPFHYTPQRETIVAVTPKDHGNTVIIETECRNKKDRFYHGYAWRYKLCWDGSQWPNGPMADHRSLGPVSRRATVLAKADRMSNRRQGGVERG